MKNQTLIVIVFVLTFMLTFFTISWFIHGVPFGAENDTLSDGKNLYDYIYGNTSSPSDSSGISGTSGISETGVSGGEKTNEAPEDGIVYGAFPPAETPDSADRYIIDPYFPADKDGNIRLRNTGTYTLSDDRSSVYVVRSVTDLSVIPVSSGSTGDFFFSTKVSDVVFIQSEDLTPTMSSFYGITSGPVYVTVPYEISKNNSGRYIKTTGNFTGIVCYTLSVPVGNTITVNDGSEAVRIILPEGVSTGSRIFGKASPKPDLNIGQADRTTLLQWNDAAAVSVSYYESYAPKAMGIIVAVLGIITLVFLAFRSLQILALRHIINSVDDGESGFRKNRG